MQKVYIHSYFSLVDFWALRKHMVTNIDDFVILTPPGSIFLRIWYIFHLFGHWGQFFMNFGYFFTYFATGDKLGTIEILVANAKALYPFKLLFGGFWGIEEAYFDKYCRFLNFDRAAQCSRIENHVPPHIYMVPVDS